MRPRGEKGGRIINTYQMVLERNGVLNIELRNKLQVRTPSVTNIEVSLCKPIPNYRQLNWNSTGQTPKSSPS